MSAHHDKEHKPGEVPTTGHSWDGIEELDNPMPRWWLWTWYACIFWAVLYSIAYPAWPLINGATQGILGYNRVAELQSNIDKFTEIGNDPELQSFAKQSGAAVFKTWCAQCHGSGAGGNAGGYPNLLDDDWLWGGSIEDIHTTVTHGIRNTMSEDARFSQMPAFGEMLEETDISNVVQYVRQISGQQHDAAMATEGETVFADNCSGCHAEDGTGDRGQGAPNLTDAIWLYGGDVDALTHTVTYARAGVMPAWNARLTEADIRSVAVYVHSLGGGE
jgi:cytochrome c oxidase cbb3-type subunit 3